MSKRMDDPLFSREKKPRFRGLTVFALVLLVILCLAIFFNMVNNRRVQLIKQSVTIPSLPSALENFRILHISDLHGARFGAQQEGIAAALQDARYEIVCITGDSVAADGDFTALLELIDLIPEGIPIYLTAGDEDPEPIFTKAHSTNNVKAEFIMAAEKRGVIYLDAPQKITVGKSTLWLCPDSFYSLDLAAAKKALTDYQKTLEGEAQTDDVIAAQRAIEYRLDMIARTEEARSVMLSSDTSIAVTHVPFTEETVRTLRQWAGDQTSDFLRSVSLVLSGHYNNGQFRLPFVGALYVPASTGLGNEGWLPDNHLVSGVSIVQGVTQYISPGLGNAKLYPWFPFRFCNSPSVTILTLTTKLVN